MNVLSDSALRAFGWTLLDFIWQGALLAGATALAMRALRKAGPESRYAVGCVALLACLALPTFTLLSRLAGHGATPIELEGAISQLGTGSLASTSVFAWLEQQLHLLVQLWAACAAVLTLRLLLGLAGIARFGGARRASAEWQARLSALALRMGVARTIRLRIVDQLRSPVTAGWWRPVVLVPASLLTHMPSELLEALLAHEIAHIKRFDYLVNLGQNVVEIVLFYHPAVWWISGRIRVERELIADDIAAAALGEPKRLARALSELERSAFSVHLAQAANTGDLLARVRRLTRPDHPSLRWHAALPALGILLAIALLIVNGHAPRAFSRTAVSPRIEAADNARVAGPQTTPARAQAPGTARTTIPAHLDFESCAKPVYPSSALQQEHTGTVTLSFSISKDGAVSDSLVSRSSGHETLDDAARNAISLCHFQPATNGGKPIKSWVQVKYMWTLAD